MQHDEHAGGLQQLALAGRFGLTVDDVLLGCSPLGHMTGYAAVMMLGLRLGGTVVLQDLWEVKQGVTIMARGASPHRRVDAVPERHLLKRWPAARRGRTVCGLSCAVGRRSRRC